MHPNQQLLIDFYGAFNQSDGDTMAASYHDTAQFSDPVFTNLDADGARAMWRMLTDQATDLRVESSNIVADETAGSARWEAWYTFSVTDRKVHNIIDARFEFQDGKITRHVDSFDFWRWTRHALGLPGILLGWTPLIQNKIRHQAARGLQKWREKAER